MEKIALVAIAYNRIGSLRRLLKSLEQGYYGDESNIPLIISIDKSDTDEVELFADAYHWPYGEKHVVKHTHNLGLKKHVLSQGKWLGKYDAIVVLEDDVVVAEDFWRYVRSCVAKYKDSEAIAGISLYGFSVNYHLRHPFIPVHHGDDDVYFMNCAMSWGQVWMRKSWNAFQSWYAEHQNFEPSAQLPESVCAWGDKSWLKFHTTYCIEENKYFVFPYVSYSSNFGDCGIHMSAQDTIYQVPLLLGRKHSLFLPSLSDDGEVLYDGFFENKRLYDCLGLSQSECCLDLNRTNANRENKRFWLTTRILPYKVVRHFALELRPIELNVLMQLEQGEGIFLYDTTVVDKEPEIGGNPAFLVQHYVQNAFLFLREYGYANVLRDFFRVLRDKFQR